MKCVIFIAEGVVYAHSTLIKLFSMGILLMVGELAHIRIFRGKRLPLSVVFKASRIRGVRTCRFAPFSKLPDII